MTTEIRSALAARLPKLVQPAVTFLTGEPTNSEVPLFRHNSASRIASASFTLILGVSLSVGWTWGGAAFLAVVPIGLLLTTGAMRTLYVGIAHHASHGTVLDTPRANAILGDVISMLLVTLAHDRYQVEHARDHHSPRKLSTQDDPDLRFLIDVCGFDPSRSRAWNWTQLARILTSPRWYATYFLARIRGSITSPTRAVAVTFIQATVFAGLTAATKQPLAWFVGWFIPLVVGFAASAVLQFLSEHRWLAGKPVTIARFLGDAPPNHAVGWVKWLGRAVTVHLAARVAVLVSDLSQHDLHHVMVRSDWANPSFARRDYLLAHPGRLHDAYGSLADHIDATFVAWEILARQATATTPLPQPILSNQSSS
ncbi:fatty acid desaturase [Bradyrhizobium sp. RD5-C2]|uniref:fatty acid desaturase n=1 Tax=Bradyrhizobium sp. RD5-C2 TaxID=244562 RepID=UPI001CC6062F|nr:fatty acid desaturase [Bradyrhizobium sp. RD5-C2]GIQ75955.1 hypothetical protein BraRD5C2_43980 [Bradyrhizobium sp. RD5-C2]